MSRLVALEPAGLRKVLKAGLRQGIADQALRHVAKEAFGWNDEASSCDQLLQVLEARGWLIRQGETWKTRLG